MSAPPSRRLVAAAVMLGAIMAIIDTSIVNVALPTMSGNLGATSEEIAWVATVYIMATAVVMPMTGYLTALLGRKRFYTGALVVFVVASVLCGRAWDLGSLVFFRILQGLGGGVLMPTAQSILLETYPKQEHGKAMATFGLGAMAGPAIGPTLGGWLVDRYDWRLIFDVNLPIGIVAVLLSLLYIQDPPGRKPPEGDFDTPGLLSMTVGLSALQYVLERGQQEDWFESSTIVMLTVLGVVSLAGFLYRQLRLEHPLVDLRVFRDPTFVAGNVIGVSLGFGLFGLNLILPLFLTSVLRYSAWQTGLALVPGALASAVVMPLAGRLADRTDPRIPIAMGLLGNAISAFQLSHLTAQAGYWDFVWPRIVQGFAMGLTFVPLTTITMSQIPRHRMANASGLFTLVRQMGGSMGIAALTTMLSRHLTLHAAQLAEHVTRSSPQAVKQLGMLQAAFQARGESAGLAGQHALALTQKIVLQQALVLTYADLFRLSGGIFVACLGLLFFLKKSAHDHGAPGDEPHLAMAE